jgi:hypothetical protein
MIAEELGIDKACLSKQLWLNKWVLHQENPPAHTVISVRQFLKQNWTILMDILFVVQIWLHVTSFHFKL